MWDIFLSYSTKDALIAELVKDALRQRSLTVWHDVENIRELDDIPGALSHAIRQTRLTVLLISQHHLASRVCQWEALCSLSEGDTAGRDRIALVLLDDALGSLSPSLRGRRAIDLRHGEVSAAAEILASHPALAGPLPGSSDPIIRPFVGLPGSSGGRFIFRIQLLLEMHSELSGAMRDADRGVVAGQRVVILHGMGGAGKSSVALFFIEQFGHSYSNGVAWASIGGDRIDNEIGSATDEELVFRAAVDGLVGWCRVSDPSRTAALLADLPADPRSRWAMLRDGIGHWLGSGDRLLLVLDDVPGGMPLEELLPQDPRVAVIVTTRDAQSAGSGFRTIPVDNFTPFESMLLLTRAVEKAGKDSRLADPWQGDRTRAEAIAARVGYHPLAIDLIAHRLETHESLSSIADDIEAISEDFFDVASDVTRLPGRHTASIMATIAGSLRGSVANPREAPARIALLRLLMVMPAASSVPLALIQEILPTSPSRTVRFLSNRSLVSFTPERGTVRCHAVTRDVARYLWKAREAPFADTHGLEPDLSRRVTDWLSRHMARAGQNDLRVGSADALAMLAVLDDMTMGPDDAQRVHRAEAHMALAREAVRVGIADLAEFDFALRHAVLARDAVSPPASDWLAMTWWSAEAMRGLLLRQRADPKITPFASHDERSAALTEAFEVINEADSARRVIGERMLAAGEGTPPLSWVRERLAASMFNLTGFRLKQAQLEADRAETDRNRITDLLSEMDALHERLIGLRTQADAVNWSAVASSMRGRALAAYHRALMAPDEESRHHLDIAASHALTSIRVRRDCGVPEETHDEIDISKSLEVLLKVGWTWFCLHDGVGVARDLANMHIERATADVGRLDTSRPYLTGPVQEREKSPQQAFRDLRSNDMDSFGGSTFDTGLLSHKAFDITLAAIQWLTVISESSGMGDKPPLAIRDSFFGRDDRPGEIRWMRHLK